MNGKRRIGLLFTLCWAFAAFGASVAPFFSYAEEMASASAYHDIRHLLLDSPPESGTEKESMAYLDHQRVSLNRTRAWHAATSLLLSAFCITRLKRARGTRDTGASVTS